MMYYKKRVYGKTKEFSIDELKRVFSDNRLSYIKLALLFGSRATNRATFQSDYDIAILTDSGIEAPWGVEAKLWSDILDIWSIAEYDLDIIDLSNASSLMLESIKEGYILLKGEESELQRVFDKDSKDSQ